jgi:hypothetical protein
MANTTLPQQITVISENLTTPDQTLAAACAARHSGDYARAAGYMEWLLHSFPNDARVFTEALLLAAQTCDDTLAVRLIRDISTLRGNALDQALGIAVTALFNRSHAPTAVNIGGGPNFQAPFWRNFDGVSSPANPQPCIFSPQTQLPVQEGSVELVYSSHCIEHLDDQTVEQLMREARRIINKRGYLLLKIPDFEYALECWNSGDERFFSDENWNLQSCSPFLAKRGFAWDLDYRAAMIFCGFWNEEHGNHFDRNVVPDPAAYHGPPVAPREYIRSALSNSSPHEVSARLTDWIRKHEPTYTFNHQNAWSRAELQTLLERNGFEVCSFDREVIVRRFADLPTIHEMRELSLYCAAIPK